MSDLQNLDMANRLVPYSSPAIEASRTSGFDERMPGSREMVPLANYWYVLLRRKWTVIGIAAVLTAIAAVVSFHMTPVYEATARLEIEPETPSLQSQASSGMYERADADDAYLSTQAQVLKSDNLAWQTIQQLNLASHLDRPGTVAPTDPDKRKLQLLGAFSQKLKVEIVPKTRMLAVAFRHADPRVAADVANKLIDVYLEYNFKEKDEAIRRSGWMEGQLASLKNDVEHAQEALVNYEQENQIVNSSDKQNVLEQMLGDQSRDLAAAESDRIAKESLYRQVLANREQAAAMVHDDLLESLEEKGADLKEEYTQSLSQYGPNFPNVKRFQLQVNENKDQIEYEQQRILNRMRNDYDAANDREKMVAASVAHQKDEVGRLNQLLVRDTTLRHEFETSQQLYESVLQSLKDATVSAALRSTNIHLVDSALPPNYPVRPNKMMNIMVALWAGVIIGLVGVFAQESMDSSIKTAEEAEVLSSTPALGVIPFERGSWLKAPAFTGGSDANNVGLSLMRQPNSSLSEAFRALGTAVLVPSRNIKTLLITSAQNGEGKTTTALNLAQVLAQRRGPVLLIDCDLRKGKLGHTIGQRDHKGLTDVLSGEVEIADTLFALQPGLWVLPAGTLPEDPVAVLASQELAALLEKLTSRFEFVIIDSPPVLAVTDAAILAGMVDGILLVAASGLTSQAGFVRTRRMLEASGGKILGMAVNKLDPRRPGYGYSYSKYAYK